MKEKVWDKKIYYLVAIILVLLAGLYMLIAKSGVFGLGHPEQGEIIISGIDQGTKVFIDGEKALPAYGSNGSLVRAYPGRRAVIIAKDGYWPWMKYINVESELASEASPFLVPKAAKTEIIGSDDPEYDKLSELISSNRPPSGPSVMFSADRSTSIWVSNGTIFARWESSAVSPPAFCIEKCSPEIAAFHSDIKIKNIAFFGTRNDVIIVSLGKFIYGLELDRREVQNFEPIYQGEDPKFYKASDGALIVSDQGSVMRIPP